MVDESHKSLEATLVDDAIKATFFGLVLDIGEASLDTIFEDGYAKDIPILGSIVKLAQLGFGIRDRIFAKKILSFLQNLDKSSEAERIAFQKQMEDENVKRKVGEQLIIFLDQADHMEKAIWLSKLFSAFSQKKIDSETWNLYSSMINRGFVKDIKALFEYLQNEIPLEAIAQNRLFAAGFMEMLSTAPGMVFGTHSIATDFTPHSKSYQLIEIIFDQKLIRRDLSEKELSAFIDYNDTESSIGPLMKGTSIPLNLVLDSLKETSPEIILNRYPELTMNHIKAAQWILLRREKKD